MLATVAEARVATRRKQLQGEANIPYFVFIILFNFIIIAATMKKRYIDARSTITLEIAATLRAVQEQVNWHCYYDSILPM